MMAAVGCAANLPMPFPQLIHRLSFDEFVILEVKDAGGGVMGAKRIQLQFDAEPRVIETKWKATTASGDSWNNSPHREIGTYAVQWLFLDADQYIVPPTVVRSIPLVAYHPISVGRRSPQKSCSQVVAPRPTVHGHRRTFANHGV